VREEWGTFCASCASKVKTWRKITVMSEQCAEVNFEELRALASAQGLVDLVTHCARCRTDGQQTIHDLWVSGLLRKHLGKQITRAQDDLYFVV
jgi:hypothetical protein